MLSGFTRWVWSLLAAGGTPTVLGLWLGLGAVVGLFMPPGQHPAEGALVHIPMVLLPFAFAARALRSPGKLRAGAGLCALGLAVAALGAAFAGGVAGVTRAGTAGLVESYAVTRAGQTVSVHLGGQLVTAQDPSGAIALRLGVGPVELGTAVLPAGDAEVGLGPWAVHHHARQTGDEPTEVRLRVRPRAGEGAASEHTLRAGQAIKLPGDAQLLVDRLSADYGRALGPAAQITLTTPADVRTDWFFLDAPDLDARTGTGPYEVELLDVTAQPVLTLGVRRRGPWVPALAGWVILAAGLLALGFTAPADTTRKEAA